MKRILFAALLLFACGSMTLSAAPAPTHVVKGVVADETGEPLPGAYVLVKGSSRGVLTDADGTYSLDAADSETLVFQFLGFEDTEVKVAGQTVINVSLKLKGDALDEVTVVAYGTQRKASVIGAISTIETGALRMPVGNLSSALAGKMAGLVVLQRTSEPGAGADFWIRGVNTFGSNSRPLVLVDGIERSMDNVDVEDIASFSILKDATATALYGVRGANGIIIITTKRGAESEPKVSVKAEFGTTTPVQVPKMASTSQWIDFYNELYHDQGSAPVISEYEKELYLSGTDPDLYPSVDWMKTVFKDFASTSKYNVSVTGGSPKWHYYVGGSYYHEGGILNTAANERYDSNMDYNKFSFRSNVDINITKSTVLGLSLSTQYSIRNTPGISDVSNIYSNVMQVTPIATPVIYSDGTFARAKMGRNPYNDINNMGYRRENNMTAQSLLSLTQYFGDIVDWLDGLQANLKVSWDAFNGAALRRYIDPPMYRATGRDSNGALVYEQVTDGDNYMQLARSNSSSTTINAEASATYERTIATNHRVSGMFLFSIRNYQNNMAGNYIEAFPYRNIGIAGRATYSYGDRYFSEFNFGYNGSENFAPGHKFGFFPSYALGYLISNEPFWNGIKDKVSLLKFKVSYGKIGNDQIGGGRRFAFNTTMNTGAAGFAFGDGSNRNYESGISTGDMGNAEVTWEEAQKFNAGFELELFRHFKLNADYFQDNRKGIFILRESTPSVVGVNVAQYVNLGHMINRGVDLSVEYDHNFSNGLYVSGRANYTYSRNKRLYDDKPDQIYRYQNLAGYINSQQMGLIAEGLFESESDIMNWPVQTFSTVRPGDIKYRDVNGDGLVDKYDMVPIGYSTIPEINYGFGLSVAYKGFDASVFFSGVGHVTRIIGGNNLSGATYEVDQLGQIYADVAEHRWTLTNYENGVDQSDARYPRLSLNEVDNNTQASTFWQKDMSFLRLKNAELGYTIPKKAVQKLKLSTVRFYVSGVNLLTFSKFKLWDPELNVSYGNAYPQMQTYTFGVNVNF